MRLLGEVWHFTVDIAPVVAQIMLAVFLLNWFFMSLLALCFAILKAKPESTRESVSIALREAPQAIFIGLVMFVSLILVDSIKEVTSSD